MSHSRAEAKQSSSSSSPKKEAEEGSNRGSSTFGPRGQGPLRAGGPAVGLGAGTQGTHEVPDIQRMLTIGELGNKYEREAERVAEQVMAAPADRIVSGVPSLLHRFTGDSNGEMDAAPPSVDRALANPGEPLKQTLRQEMEQRFGSDFSGVRVHTGATAEQSARDVNARAYTVGHDVVFGAGRFVPETHEGRRLIAHELTHVTQNRPTAEPDVIRREPADGPGQTGVTPTYGNLPRDLPAPGSSGNIVRLKEVGGTWKEIGPRYTRTARGNYDFVVKEGEIFAVKAKLTMGAIGHTEAARGERVNWAGQVKFEAGQVRSWDDGSGHYRPLSSTRKPAVPGGPLESWRQPAVQAGLPDDKFVQHPETARRPRPKASAPQLPVYQPAPRSRTPGEPPKVGAGPARMEEFEARYGKPPATPPATSTQVPSPATPASAGDKPTKTPGAARPTEPPDMTKAAEPPAATKPAVPPTAAKPATEPSATRKSRTPRTQNAPPRRPGGGVQVVSTAARAAQRTYSALGDRFTSQLSKVITSKDPEMGAAIADVTRLLDAQAFLRNPKQYSKQYAANFLASYMIDGAFGKLERQFAEAKARFFSTYPDVRNFSQQTLGYGMNLNALQRRYEETSRNLRIPDARKALATVFLTFDLNENSPKEEWDLRFRVINQYLSRHPQIGTYVKEFDEAKANYAFGLAVVGGKIYNLEQQLGELPGDFADNIRRRGDALFSAAKILEEFYDQVFLLSALPGGSGMLLMLLQLSEGFAGLGRDLHQFAYRAGGRQAEYKRELTRLETEADRLGKIRGVFDVIYPTKPGR